MSYDHRIIDGREAVLVWFAMKEALEDPPRLLLDLVNGFKIKQAQVKPGSEFFLQGSLRKLL